MLRITFPHIWHEDNQTFMKKKFFIATELYSCQPSENFPSESCQKELYNRIDRSNQRSNHLHQF